MKPEIAELVRKLAKRAERLKDAPKPNERAVGFDAGYTRALADVIVLLGELPE